MKFLRVVLAWLALSGAAYAQSQLGAGQVLGNNTAATRPPQAASVTSILDRALGSTRGSIIERGAGGWAIVGPGTAGLPWVSAGAGADPLYQILGIIGGGTGINVYAIGDIICATGTTTLSKISDVATGNALISGGVGACPTYGKITSAHITGQALTKVDDTNVTATLGGTPTSALVNAASITLGWTGTLAIGRGGTGAGTQQAAVNAILNCPPTRAGDITYYNGTNWICLAGNNTGTRLLQEDASGVPSWVTSATGNVSNTGTPVANQVAQWTNATTIQGVTLASLLINASVQASPANPTGTASAALVMMGLGASCTVTPALTGRVRFSIQGYMSNTTTSAQVLLLVKRGTGAAPANAAAAAGTAVGSQLQSLAQPANYQAPFSAGGVVTGLSTGVAVWFDASIAQSGGGTASIGNISCDAFEF